jgi:hypothetical protein
MLYHNYTTVKKRNVFEFWCMDSPLVQKLIKTIIFSSRMAEVNDRFRLLFNDLLKSKFDDKHPETLRDLLEYETVLAWASLPLDSALFVKNKDTLAAEWEYLKKEYQIA